MRNLSIVTKDKSWRRTLLTAAALLAAWAVILWRVPVHFMFDDDEALMQILSGARSGTPHLYDVYNSPLLSAPVSLLYRLVPGIAWYPLLLVSVTVASCVCCCVLPVPDDRRSAVLGAIEGVVLAACAFLPSAVFLQYSIAGAAAGAAVCLLMMDTLFHGRTHTAGILLFGFFAICLRGETAAVAAAMTLTAILTALIARDGGIKAVPLPRTGRLALPAGVLAALLFVSAGAGRLAANSPEWKEFTEFNEVRTSFLDYPHPGWEETDAYREAGWDEPLFRLAEDWFFLDPRIDTDALSAIRTEIGWKGRLDSDPVRSFRRMLTANNQVRDLFLFLAGMTGVNVLLSLCAGKRRRIFACLLPGAAFMGGAAILCLIGRHPPHAFYVLAIPSAAMETFLFLQFLRGTGKRILPAALALTAVLAGAVLAANSAVHSLAAALGQETLSREARSTAINAYAYEHPDSILLTDTTVTGAGAPFDADPRPVNRFFWGGWYYATPVWEEQLTANGISALTPEMLYSDRVLFLSAPGSDLADLLAYLTERFGETRPLCLEEREYFSVYRFERGNNS